MSGYKTAANYLPGKTPPTYKSEAVTELWNFRNTHSDLMTGY